MLFAGFPELMEHPTLALPMWIRDLKLFIRTKLMAFTTRRTAWPHPGDPEATSRAICAAYRTPRRRLENSLDLPLP